METPNRYIIVSNSGADKIYKILDLQKMELLPDTYYGKPFDECLALNNQIGVTVIEFAPQKASENER